MIEKKVTRGHEVREGEYWAWTREEFVNGDDNAVIRTIEEKVELDHVVEVLDTKIMEMNAEIDKVYSRTKHDIKKTEKRIRDIVNTRDYLEFKKFYESDDRKKFDGIKKLQDNKVPVDDILSINSIKDRYELYLEGRETEQFKSHYITYMDEVNLGKLKIQKENLELKKDEAVTWKKQFEDIRKEMENESN